MSRFLLRKLQCKSVRQRNKYEVAARPLEGWMPLSQQDVSRQRQVLPQGRRPKNGAESSSNTRVVVTRRSIFAMVAHAGDAEDERGPHQVTVELIWLGQALDNYTRGELARTTIVVT